MATDTGGFVTTVIRVVLHAWGLMPISRRTRERLRAQLIQHATAISVLHGDRPRDRAELHRRARRAAGGKAIGHREPDGLALDHPLPATLIAFYLPQYHAIPENDRWWGHGFTEWRNVTRALPQFEGHAQPRLPADLGYYDLGDVQKMREQAELARRHGLGAFCFYFYWFGGKTLLETPLRQWLADKSINFSFCLCWANENWTRRWDGRPGDTLISQQHNAGDDLAFIEYVSAYLRDPRYFRVGGKPLLLVYRTELLPDPAATAERWRQWCRDNGVGEIFLGLVQAFEIADPTDIGFDAAVEFPPNTAAIGQLAKPPGLVNPEFLGQLLDWRGLVQEFTSRADVPYRLFPGVNCGWDNEPRRPGAGRVYLHASPRRYRDWLDHAVHRRLAGRPESERIVFINAWNEWAEGAALEPDTRLGHAWLQATRNAMQPRSSRGRRPCVVIHAWHLDALEDLLEQAALSGRGWRVLVTTAAEKEPEVRAILAARDVAAEVVPGENRGRDILPFLRVADRLLDEGEDLVLKLHTKRSLHRDDGDQWRRELVSGLASPEAIDRCLARLENDPSLGMIIPEGHMQPMHYFWGANERNVLYLISRLGLAPPDLLGEIFAAGSMFWVRLEALRPLLDAHLDEWEFECEAGQVDGTFAHAIERVMAFTVKSAGYKVGSSAAVDEDDQQPSSYRFAARD